MNSGYDLIIQREKGQDEYEDMQKSMLLHVQRVQRYYEKLEKENKAFGSKSLILRFAEPVGEGGAKYTDISAEAFTNRVLAERLRKFAIRVCSLTPFILNTNNLISEFIVKYPQKQMGESLTSISKKRFRYQEKNDETDERETKYSWYWEEDEYHALSNYYYITAIYDFYDYYKNYEKLYIDYYEQIRDELVKDTKYSEGVRKYYKEIEDEKNIKIKEVEDKKSESDRELEELKKVNEQLEKEVTVGGKFEELIKEMLSKESFFDEKFLKSFIKALRLQLAKEMAEHYAGQYKDEDTKQKIQKSLEKPVDSKNNLVISLLKALFIDVILPSAIAGNTKPDGKDGGGAVNLGKSGEYSEEGKFNPADLAQNARKLFMDEKIFDKWFAMLFDDYLHWDVK